MSCHTFGEMKEVESESENIWPTF